MPSIVPVFLGAAAVIGIGFLASRLFLRTRFPDIPVLLGVGLLLGPGNRYASAHGYGSAALADALAPAKLLAVTPLVAALALVVLLFDSGLQLDFRRFRKALPAALLHTVPLFILTVGGIAILVHGVWGMPAIVAIMLGVALSNVGQTVSAAVIRDMHLGQDVRAIYFVEMALYDLISIPLMIGIAAFAASPADASLAPSAYVFFRTILVSILVGVGGGILWLRALPHLRGKPFAYMLTFAMLLLVYAVARETGGSGAIAVLLFGLVIGNRRSFGRLAGAGADDQQVRAFHNEVTFLVRTGFFLFLGLTFTVRLAPGTVLAAPGTPLAAFPMGSVWALGVVGIVVMIIAARFITVRLISAVGQPERRALFHVFGRGLGTAVLAALPYTLPQYAPGTPYHDLFAPWQQVFLNLAAMTILLTVLASAFFVWRIERGRPRRAEPVRPIGRKARQDGS